MKSFRLQLLLGLSALAILYALVVLGQVAGSYDLRIYSLFTNESTEEPDGAEIVFAQARDGDVLPNVVLKPGDRVMRLPYKVGDGQWIMRRVPTFPHFNRAVAQLSPLATEAEEYLPSDEADVTEQNSKDPVMLVDVGANRTRWAKVEIERLRPDGGFEPATVFMRLQQTPISSVLLSLAWFLLKVIIFVIGATVLWKRPGDISAQMFFLLCAITLVAFMGGFHWLNLLGSPWLLYPFVVAAMMLPPVTMHFYLVFPSPHIILRRWPSAALAVIYGVPALAMLALIACLYWVNSCYEQVSLEEVGLVYEEVLDTARLTHSMDVLRLLINVSLSIAAVWFVVSLGILVQRFVKSGTRAERNQVKWILFAAVPASVLLGYVLYMATTQPALFAYGTTTRAMMLMVSLLFTAAYAVSITRYKLMQAGRLINRGLLYFAISFAAMALFCLMVGGWTLLSGNDQSFVWENVLVVGLTAMLVLVLMGWAGNRFQKISELRFHREKFQLDRAMQRLGRAVDQLVESSQLVQQMLQSALDAVSATKGVVFLRSNENEGFQRIAGVSYDNAPTVLDADCPLVGELRGSATLTRWFGAGPPLTAGMWMLEDLGGELAFALEGTQGVNGIVLLGAKEDGSSYSHEDRNFLVALARTTSLALESSRGHQIIEHLREELQEKVDLVAEQQQRIMFLQGQLIDRRGGSQSAVPVKETNGNIQLRHEIRGSSIQVREMLGKVAKIAQSSSSVLIRGESGTGKELLAKAVHENSPRAEGPFITVHCAALSPGLLESELFGHVKGAFTGADRDRVGRFEMADCGTLFLDEIGDINLETQTKLLRVLQEQAFERVGGVETIRVDVRLIAATHRDLEQLIRQGRFREDLYYRLNVISITSPPLRDRVEDIYELAYHFVRQFAAQTGKPIERIEKDALAALTAYSWPGNIRQLENAIERSVVLAEGNTLCLGDLPPEILSGHNGRAVPLRATRSRSPRSSLPPEVASPIYEPAGVPNRLANELEQHERERLEAVLMECSGNKSRAARLLGIPRSTLFSKLRKHGIG